MPAPQDMASAAAYLAGQPACRGQVVFSAGPELSLIAPPRLIEAVRTADTADFAASLDTLVPVVLGPAEERQRSTGGSNARFGPVFDQPGTTGPVAGPASRRCLVVADNAALAGALAPALARCGMTAIHVGASSGFAAAEEAVRRAGDLDAIVIAPGSFAAGPAASTWEEMLAGYASTTDCVLAHAGWLRAAARAAVPASRPLRVVHLADATSPARHPAAQAVAQLARCANLVGANLVGASLQRPDLVDVFSIALETAEPADHQPVAQLAARLLWSGDAGPLRGAEMFARPGWIGVRSHPGPAATASYGSAAIPPWIGDWLAEVAL